MIKHFEIILDYLGGSSVNHKGPSKYKAQTLSKGKYNQAYIKRKKRSFYSIVKVMQLENGRSRTKPRSFGYKLSD